MSCGACSDLMLWRWSLRCYCAITSDATRLHIVAVDSRRRSVAVVALLRLLFARVVDVFDVEPIIEDGKVSLSFRGSLGYREELRLTRECDLASSLARSGRC